MGGAIVEMLKWKLAAVMAWVVVGLRVGDSASSWDSVRDWRLGEIWVVTLAG